MIVISQFLNFLLLPVAVFVAVGVAIGLGVVSTAAMFASTASFAWQ